ncbi:MAG: hypothetical protein ACD_58C00283G0004 [uncultured bacterium]|nr:MAG: hypothetical protein ACD_58C00283G0004 [uncultured bacterium]
MAQDPSQKISDDNVITDIEEIKDVVSDQVVSESEVDMPIKDDEDKSDTPKENLDKVTKEIRLNLKTDKQAGQRGWYVIHTYTGYEDQVADSLRQRIESLDMQDKIYDVIVPIEKEIEIKNGKRKVVEKKIFPGYVLVDMIVTDDSWYVVRNTPNVTGFIGLGVRPTAISITEMESIKKRMGVEEPKFKIELKPDDLVRIIDGPLKGFEAKVVEIDEQRGKIKVLMNMFGRETPVNLDSLQVKKI